MSASDSSYSSTSTSSTTTSSSTSSEESSSHRTRRNRKSKHREREAAEKQQKEVKEPKSQMEKEEEKSPEAEKKPEEPVGQKVEADPAKPAEKEKKEKKKKHKHHRKHKRRESSSESSHSTTLKPKKRKRHPKVKDQSSALLDSEDAALMGGPEDFPVKEVFKMLKSFDDHFEGCLADFTLPAQAIANLLAMDKGAPDEFQEGAQVIEGDPALQVGLIALEATSHFLIRAMGKLSSKPETAADYLLSALPLLLHGTSRIQAHLIMEAAGISAERRRKEQVKVHVPREARSAIDATFFPAGAGASGVPGTPTVCAISPPAAATPTIPNATATPTLGQPTPGGELTLFSPTISLAGQKTPRGLPPPEEGAFTFPISRRGSKQTGPDWRKLLPAPTAKGGRAFPFPTPWHNSPGIIEQNLKKRYDAQRRERGRERESKKRNSRGRR
jgi:hypothetical protein